MNRRGTLVFAAVAAILTTSFPAYADPPLSDLSDHDWFALRAIDDPGQGNETAAYLKVTSATGSGIEGTLWLYRKSGRRHIRQSSIAVEGRWIKQNRKRRTAFLDSGSSRFGAITYWQDTGDVGGKQLRVVLRIFPSFFDEKRVTDCDTPPDDDILEEEPEILGEPVPEFDEGTDPYP